MARWPAELGSAICHPLSAIRLDTRLAALALGLPSCYLNGMFTGIIEEVGEVVSAGVGDLRIRARKILADAGLGDSIAINGVDLTITEISGDVFAANVMPETYRRSDLGSLKAGDQVNLERSVRPMDRLSGHIVRGVVEGVATVDSLRPEGDAIIVRFCTPPELLRYILVKGPVAIDGASLTVIA